MIEQHNPTFFGILEANMGADCHAPSLNIQGFSLERDNLMKNKIRTRAALYIADTVSYIRRLDLELPETPMIWIEIKSGSAKPWLLMTGYRQWRTLKGSNKNASKCSMKAQKERFNMWAEAWKKADSEGKRIIVMGDLNIDVEPWAEEQTILSDYQVSMAPILSILRETAQQLNFTLLKTPPTRFQGTNKPSTLDIVLSNKPELITNILLYQTTSDHKLLAFKTVTKVRKKCVPIRKA